MSLDTPRASLPELLRSLNIAPDTKFALMRVAEQVERNTAQLDHQAEHKEMLASAAAGAPVPRHPRPHRDRHGLHLVPAPGTSPSGAESSPCPQG